MRTRPAPIWTGVVIGLLLGLLLGGAVIVLRQGGNLGLGGHELASHRSDDHQQSGLAGTDSEGAGGSTMGGSADRARVGDDVDGAQRGSAAQLAAASTAAEGTGSATEGPGPGRSAGEASTMLDAPADTGAAARIASCRQTAIVRATQMAAPAVVSINVVQHRTYRQSAVPPGFEFFQRMYPGMFPFREYQRDVQNMGSGFIVSHDGYVLTNEHLVGGAAQIIVTLTDGRQFDAELLETVPQYDLALLRVHGEDLPVVRMGNRNDLQAGEWAIAIGSPFGYLLADTQPTVTVGVISAVNRDIKRTEQGRNYLGMIQTDAAINPGNSGGPLLNADGEVIGINTFIFTESGGSIGIGFAVPIERAKWLIDEVREYGRYRRIYAGLAFQKLSPNLVRAMNLDDPVGFIVLEVDEGSPAWRAGLRVRDIIRSINDTPLRDWDTVTRLIYEAKVGTRLTFTAERDGKRFTGEFELEEARSSESEG
jgi:serine protease Do